MPRKRSKDSYVIGSTGLLPIPQKNKLLFQLNASLQSYYSQSSIVLARDHFDCFGMDIFGDIRINFIGRVSSIVRIPEGVELNYFAVNYSIPLMDEYFLLENCLTLRAMSKFGLLWATFICMTA
ncbi:hypothetical protein VNO78_18577 [Psophocarpus tetragonolobus]|uniref:Uncharacterized protein n=1 Tax=Psophocarpus tetragonolobus TaxID=3891 RepID=A0AAN9XMB5_PSOTE